MKLISLNVAGGKWLPELLQFLREQNETTDIFCLQEVIGQFGYDEIPIAAHRMIPKSRGAQVCSNRIQKVLEHKQSYFVPHEDFELEAPSGNAMYVKYSSEFTGLKRFDFQSFPLFTYRQRGKNVTLHAMYFGFYDLQKKGKVKTKLCVLNVHGIWEREGKIDTVERLEQMRKIKEAILFIKRMYRDPQIILCADFNLNPDTESIRAIEDLGLRNLITEFGITNTRSEFYEKKGRFADYIFVSEGVEVKDFKTLDVSVSDHLPLCLEFELIE